MIFGTPTNNRKSRVGCACEYVNSRPRAKSFFFPAGLSRRQGGDVGETYSLSLVSHTSILLHCCTHLTSSPHIALRITSSPHPSSRRSALSSSLSTSASERSGSSARLAPRLSPLAANLCAPANHHRISRRLHHRSSSPERHLEVRAHVKPKSHSSHFTPSRVLLSLNTLNPLPPTHTLHSPPLRSAQKSCSAIDSQSWRQSQRH